DGFPIAAECFHDDVVPRRLQGASCAFSSSASILEFALKPPSGVVADDDDDGETVTNGRVHFSDIEPEGAVAGDHRDAAAGMRELERDRVGQGGSDRAERAKTEPASGLARGEDRTAPVDKVAAVPGIQDVRRKRRGEFAVKRGGVYRG